MDNQSALHRLRMMVNDPDSMIWQDDFLLTCLLKAKREYCRRVPVLFDWMMIYPDRDGKFRWPERFHAFQYGVNRKNELLYPASVRTLIDQSGLTGEPRFIVDVGDGSYCLFPLQETIGFEYADFSSEYGVICNDFDSQQVAYELSFDHDATWLKPETGIESEQYGIIEAWDSEIADGEFGLIANITIGDPLGKIHCQQMPDEQSWEVDDYVPVCFLAAAFALEINTDRKNMDVASTFRALYERMMRSRSCRHVRSARTLNSGVFF